MNELERLFPVPRPSPHFATKTVARARRQRPAPRWMALYWLALAFLVLFCVSAAPIPNWVRLVAVPLGFVLFAGFGGVVRFLAPFFR